MQTSTTSDGPAVLTNFKSPKTVIARFVARRTMRVAAFWALAFGATVASKAIGYVGAYPTPLERARLTATLGNNVGINALLGTPHGLTSVGGFTVWSTLSVMVIIGAIWAFLLATKTFRGEEESGRWELLLSGQTTARRAACNALAGLGSSLLVLYAVTAAAFILIGRVHNIDFGVQAALFFALVAVTAAAEFMAVGALASQLMPTRSRAAELSAAVFGVCFLVRAMADTTSAHWLLNITPLGWIEKAQPLYHSQAIWMLPAIGLVLVLSALTVYLAGKRDLEAAIFADKDTAPPHLGLLKGPFSAAVRLTRNASLGWLAAIGVFAAFYGLLTKSAAQLFNNSVSLQHTLNRLAHSSQTIGATTFLGVIFFILMTIIMGYAASAINAVREDEAKGYLDNLLVGPVSRQRWLLGRAVIIVVVTLLLCLVSGLGAWLGETSQHAGVSLHVLILAGFNIAAAPLFILGLGICAMGAVPRFTSLVVYGVVAWSFLIQMISSGLNLNHWLLDTSLMHQVALAPATDAAWGTNAVLVGIGLGLGLIGALLFNRRDLAAE